MIPNFIQNSLDSCFDQCKIIPWSFQPTKFYSVKFEGWNKITMTIDYATFNSILVVARFTLSGIIYCYRDTHAFTEPQFSFRPDNGICELKIGTMENELYDELMKKYPQ